MINQDNSKVIFHIDVDSFFVSAELILRPELKNKDVAISTSTRSNSVVSALSYSAKFKGAKVPMKMYEVKSICPNIIILKPNFNLYLDVANRIYLFLMKNYTNLIEINSIDEWFLDVTKIVKQYSSKLELAKNIQKAIAKEIGVNVSIGISYNKFLAKIATDINKPQGITIIDKNNFKEIVFNLDISKYIGIGKKNEQVLRENNILKIGDLASIDPNQFWLKKLFKNKLNEYIQRANGITINETPIMNMQAKLSSIGNITTFEIGYTNDRKYIYNELKELSKNLEKRLNTRMLKGFSLTLTIKYTKEESFSKCNRFNYPFDSKEEIYEKAIKLFVNNWDEREIRAIGISISNLVPTLDYEFVSNIWNKNEEINNSKSKMIINKINEKFGKKIAYTTSDYSKDKTISKHQCKYLDK